MKTGNSTVSNTDKNRFISLIVRNKDKSNNPVAISILPFLAMLSVIWPRVLQNSPGADIAKIGILTLILTGAVTFYIKLNTESTLNKTLAKTIIVLSYLISINLLLLVPHQEFFSFWMLGGLVISMLIDNKLGLFCNFNFTFIMGIMLNLNPEVVMQILIVCVLLSVLSGPLKNKSTVVYATIIILAINITVSYAINDFAFEKTKNFNYVQSLFSILTVIVLSYIIAYFYQKVAKIQLQDKSSEDIREESIVTTPVQSSIPINDLQQEYAATQQAVLEPELEEGKQETTKEETAQEETVSLTSQKSKTSYEIFCDPENELLLRLKSHSKDLYTHAIYIGELSARAAKVIRADASIAKAGGFYHEIGIINGKNYIEEGLKIAEDYAFPNELKAIIKEHNIKYDKPTSAEAAIVMLSDNIASTINYIEKAEDNRYTTDKIIENIFQMRFDKGTFDTAGFSLKDFKLLKEFYQEEFKNRR
jgi:uncharacterized domain HDIG